MFFVMKACFLVLLLLLFAFSLFALPPTTGPKAPLCEQGAFSRKSKGVAPSLEEQIGYSFQDPSLKKQALTRNSIHNSGLESGRLGFLGDNIFNMLILDILLARYPLMDKRSLHRRWVSFVNMSTQAHLADLLSLNRHNLVFDKQGAGATKPRIHFLADILEALTGAVYLDGGYIAVKQLMARFFDLAVEHKIVHDWDYKYLFTSAMRSRFGQLPLYEVYKRGNSGFHAVAMVNGRTLGEGRGENRTEAIQKSAKAGLIKIGFTENIFQMSTDYPMAELSIPSQQEMQSVSIQEYKVHYSKLKFLGHAVLNMALADILIQQYPEWPAGDLTKTWETLLNFIKQHRLRDRALSSQIFKLGRRRKGSFSQLDAFQFFLGVQYLDEGYIWAKKNVQQFFEEFAQPKNPHTSHKQNRYPLRRSRNRGPARGQGV